MRTMMSLALVPVIAGSAMIAPWKDISRYFGIKRMSSGRTGRPGKVPVIGRTSYPNKRGRGVPDGTADFESGSRGGPAR